MHTVLTVDVLRNLEEECTRSYSFINVGNLLCLILKQLCRNAALVVTLGQPYLALRNLPEVFGFSGETRTQEHAKNTAAFRVCKQMHVHTHTLELEGGRGHLEVYVIWKILLNIMRQIQSQARVRTSPATCMILLESLVCLQFCVALECKKKCSWSNRGKKMRVRMPAWNVNAPS